MDDFTRIPTILAALEDVWLGQPDLSLGAVIGMLGNFGIDWATSDAEALAILRGIAAKHPGSISREDGRATGLFEVVTDSRAHRILLDHSRVLVLPAESSSLRPTGAKAKPRPVAMPPSMWTYSQIRQAQVGMPLLIADAEGFVHRLGVVEHIIPRSVGTPRDAAKHRLADAFYHVRREGGDDLKLLSLDGRVQAWVVGRRTTTGFQLRADACNVDDAGRITRLVLSDAHAPHRARPATAVEVILNEGAHEVEVMMLGEEAE